MHKRPTAMAMSLLALVAGMMLALSGCSMSKAKSMESEANHMKVQAEKAGIYTLTFEGGPSFHGPHGGQAIHVALVDWDTGHVVAEQNGVVSKTANPAFSFTFKHAMMPHRNYHVAYWIDSNFGGGTVGKCDAPKHDHQWNISIGYVTGNVTHMETHEPRKITPVCYLFGGM